MEISVLVYSKEKLQIYESLGNVMATLPHRRYRDSSMRCPDETWRFTKDLWRKDGNWVIIKLYRPNRWVPGSWADLSVVKGLKTATINLIMTAKLKRIWLQMDMCELTQSETAEHEISYAISSRQTCCSLLWKRGHFDRLRSLVVALRRAEDEDSVSLVKYSHNSGMRKTSLQDLLLL